MSLTQSSFFLSGNYPGIMHHHVISGGGGGAGGIRYGRLVKDHLYCVSN